MLVRPLCFACLLLYMPAQAGIFAADAPPAKAATPSSTSEAERNKAPVRQPAAEPPPLKQFIPTEKIKADSAVSFPVDI